MSMEAKDIGGGMEPAKLDEFDDSLFAQALDVQRAWADEVLEPLDALGWANQAAGAADVDLPFLGHRFAAALRAMIGEGVGHALLAAGEIFDHLRDDVAGALDAQAVADAQAQ